MEEIEAVDPDCIVVACCGFDLERNLADAREALKKNDRLRSLRAVKNNRFFALDGNRYFARPSPSLAGGAALIARCAHDGAGAGVVRSLESLAHMPAEGKGWARVDTAATESEADVAAAAVEGAGGAAGVVRVNLADWEVAHAEACKNHKSTYKDPKTGYTVFTEYGHLKRNKCCGSGCRHCPFGHELVKGKFLVDRMQQPAFLHTSPTLDQADKVTVLFWSGGQSLAYTLTHAHIHTRTRNHTRTHTQRHPHSLTFAHT